MVQDLNKNSNYTQIYRQDSFPAEYIDLQDSNNSMYDQSQQPNHYLLQVQKLMSSDVQSTYWSHNMDLLVIVTVDNVLQLYRINFKAQKVFQIDQDKEITAVAFSPDSQYISYGMGDGEIKVLKTENGEVLLTVSDHLTQQIKSFSFVQFTLHPITRIFPFKQSSLEEKLLLPIFPHKNLINVIRQAIIKLNYFNQIQASENFTILLASSEKHTTLHLNGFVTVAQVSYEQIVANGIGKNTCNKMNSLNNPNDPPTPFTIHYSHFNPHTNHLQTILLQSTPHSYILYHVSLSSTILKQLQPNIIKLNCLLSYINQIIDFVEMSYPAVQSILRDILRQYNQKMALIDDPERGDITPCEQLFKYLNYGITSTAIVNFLTKQVYDTKVLQKLDETINAGFNSLHQLLLQSVQNSLQRAYIIIHQLKGLSQLSSYQLFNIELFQLQSIQKQVQKLYTMGEILLVESTQAKFDIRNLLVWLNKATIKTSSDQNNQIQNMKSHLSRYTVDFGRLHNFVQTEDKFKLMNLLAFFNKGQEMFQMKVPECEFRLLGEVKGKETKQYIARTKEIERMLEVEDVQLPVVVDQPQTSPQLVYRSFRLQLKSLKQQFKTLKSKPIVQLSKQIQRSYTIQLITQLEASQQLMFELHPFVRRNQDSNQDELLLYYVQHHSQTQTNRLVEYNTMTRKQRFVTIPAVYQPLSIAVGVDVILLLENTMSMTDEKIIVQVVNQLWEGEELIMGKKIQQLNGEILIDAGLRGLNLMVNNKNKLVVFD